MKKYIIILIIIGAIILITVGVIMWQNYEKIEKQYKACLDKCSLEFGSGLQGFSDGGGSCRASCREKYSK